MLDGFCLFLQCPKTELVLILVWFERSLHSEQVSGPSCPWPLKLMMPQVVEGMWICMGGYGQLRGEWVNAHNLISSYLLLLFGENRC